jgi:meiotically up-regulated gene 157 (Mug157) protein
LRAVLFILWRQAGEQDNFETYYNQTMEKLIELYKSKIED